jgi:rhodanese-related sulfurtransferase
MALVLPIEVEPETALGWLAAGACLVDVRERQEREAGRIPGSIWIPIDELARRWRELPRSAPIVVHCSAGSRSFRAAKFLREQGLPAAALVGGLSAWASKGGPVEAGALELVPAN